MMITKSRVLESRSIHSKFLILILLTSLITVLGYIRSLIYLNTNSFIFHTAYLISIVTLSFLLIQFNSVPFRLKFFCVLIWIWTLMMTIPLRLPEGIISNLPDMIYETQIIKNIIVSGRVSFNAPTTYASNYAFNPMLELLIAEVSMISGMGYEIILKYLGPFLGPLSIVFLFGFYKSFLSERDAVVSSFLAGSCFHFLGFAAHTVHLSLALTFFTLLLNGLTKNTMKWIIITTLSIFMIVSTHHFSSIVGTFYFIIVSLTMLAFHFLLKERFIQVEKTIFRIAVSFLVMCISWLLYVTFSLFGELIKLSKTIWLILISTEQEISFPLTEKGVIYTPFHIVGDVSVLVYGLLAIIGFLLALTSKTLRNYKSILPFAVSGAFILITAILIYSKYSPMKDLLPRAFIYFYFSTAPLSLLAIQKVYSSFSQSTRKYFIVLTIILVCISAKYYGYASISYHYDNASPLDTEDVRFPLHEWKFAGLFVRDKVKQVAGIWGDKIAFNYIGGYGEVDVKILPKGLNITLIDWMTIYPSFNDLIILRKSMIKVPYSSYHVSEKEFYYILENNNLFYMSGEVIMLKHLKIFH